MGSKKLRRKAPRAAGNKPPRDKVLFISSAQIMAAVKGDPLNPLVKRMPFKIAKAWLGFRAWAFRANRSGWAGAHNGARECARRVRQMALGYECGQRNFT